MPEIQEESWAQWVIRQKTDPESGVNQLIEYGVSPDTALLIIMLGRIHCELVELNNFLAEPDPEDEWKHGDDPESR